MVLCGKYLQMYNSLAMHIYCYYFSKKRIEISLRKSRICQVSDNETFQLLLQDRSLLLLSLLI